MKYIMFIIVTILIGCNTEIQNDYSTDLKSGEIITHYQYPKIISKLGLQKEYDITKWNMYCIYCDDTVNFEKDLGITDTIRFASLDLKFERIAQFNDTTEINFYFYFRDTLKCDVRTVRNLGLASGAGFKRGSDSIYYYTSPTTMHRFSIKGTTSRYDNPLQPDVIAFIKANKTKLHPWFREEAKRKKIIN